MDSHKIIVSIIVPVKNAARTMEIFLKHLQALDWPRDRLEIVIVDGGSTDETVRITKAWADRLPLVLIELQNCKSPGEARNAALKVAKGDYLLFTDGDCAPRVDWVREILAPFDRDPKIGAVGGEILTLKIDPDNLTESYCEQTGFLSPAGRCQIRTSAYYPAIKCYCPHEVDGNLGSPFFATANVAFRRQAVQEIGNEFWQFHTGEDVDFCIRLQKAGWKLYYNHQAVVHHMHRVDLASYLKQWFGYGYGHPLLIKNHARPGLEINLQYFGGLSFTLPWPGKTSIYLGNFHLMHVFGFLFLVCFFLNLFGGWLYGLTLISGFLFLLFFSLYFRPILKLKPRRQFYLWAKTRYLTNWSFIKGAFKGNKEFGAFCLENSW